MDNWQKFDAIDVLLSRVSKDYKYKSAKVKQWAAELVEARIWRGGNTRTRVPVKKRVGTPKRKSSTPSLSSGASTPRKAWTKEQKEEAARKKAEEADAAALNGVRKSRRARVPSEKALEAEE